MKEKNMFIKDDRPHTLVEIDELVCRECFGVEPHEVSYYPAFHMIQVRVAHGNTLMDIVEADNVSTQLRQCAGFLLERGFTTKTEVLN